MKSKFLWLFLCCVIAVTVVAWSCNGGTTGEQEEEEEEEEEGEDSLSWTDFPTYPGANRQYEDFFDMFQQAGIDDEEYIREWRYYKTSDSSNDVTDYYRDKMPDYGWDEMGYLQMSEYNEMTMFSKNDVQDMAYVMTAPSNGDTIIALIKGHMK